MTLLGKALVFFNLAFGLLLAGWAFSMYANGIDWSDRKENNVLVGENAIQGAKLAELWETVPPAQTNWLADRDKLQEAEARLADDRVWYDKKMRHVFVDATKDNPVGQVVVANKEVIADKDDPKSGVKKGDTLIKVGEILLDGKARAGLGKDDKGYPQLERLRDRAGNPLKSLAAYNDEDDKVLRSLEAVMKKHEAQIVKANELTDKIIGDKDKGVRGLQQRIEDEKAKDAALRDEQKQLIRPQLV
ncbi:MAG TPA: hypothetical protein VH682_27205, partial [Gemmataceae bacterium]